MKASLAIGLLFLSLGTLVASSPAAAITVFSTDFESGLPPEFTAPGASIQGVQGYAGLGPVGNQFGGNFLRYDGTDVFDTQLTLTGLPPHDTLDLGFLLAVIDSWDGVELLTVTVDGALLFSHSFQLALGDSSSYVDPPGALLSSGTDLGFSGGTYYQHDRAYDLSVDPAFVGIPHTADSVTIVWRLVATPGGGANFWQGGTDESWAIDNVTVSVADATTTTTPSTTSTTTSSSTVTTSSSSSSSTSSSTPTSSSTQAPATTTTTTLAGCSAVPDGPTFTSILCRLEALRARVNAESGLGAFQPKLVQTLAKGRDRATEARDLCAASNAKKSKNRLKQVGRALIQYVHRLAGLPARKKLDDTLRREFLDAGSAIEPDVGRLRKNLLCPADAGS